MPMSRPLAYRLVLVEPGGQVVVEGEDVGFGIAWQRQAWVAANHPVTSG